MGGLNETDRLRAAGIKAKKASVSRVALSSFVVVQKGPTAHPRAHLSVDEALVEHIKQHGIPTDERRFRAREDGDRLEVIDGARRHKAATVAEAWLRKHQPRQAPLEWDRGDANDLGQLFVDTQIVICSDLDLILERLDANVSRGLPDSPAVLAATVAQIVKLNKGEPDEALMARILDRMPRTVTGPRVVLALLRWDNLSEDLRARYEAGEAPLETLPAVVEARSDERAALLDRLVASGTKTTQAAKRQANKATAERDPWARRMTPRQLEAFAARLDGVNMAHEDDEARLEGVALGLRLAMGSDARTILKGEPLAEVLHRERKAMHKARAASGKRGAK